VDTGGYLQAISCSAASFCAAADISGNALTYSGSSWNAPVMVDPNGLASVSCASASFCIAVGAGDAVTFNGGSWSAPATVDSGNFLAAVSCPSASFCGAVDSEGNGVIYNGSTWISPASVDGSNSLVSVSCPAAWFCVAVDTVGNTVTYNGGTWSAPAKIDTTGFTSVSCTSPTLCTAFDDNGDALTYTATATPLTQPVRPSNSSAPSVSGTAKVGRTLSSSTGGWSGTHPISYAYQWQRCNPTCSAIARATTSRYTLTAADQGAKVRVAVTASNLAGSAQATSARVGPVPAAGPSRGSILSLLSKILGPHGKLARIAAILKHHGFTFSFKAPSGGQLQVSWYLVPKGANIAAAKPVLAARGKVRFKKAGTVKITVNLTAKGKSLLKLSRKLKLTAKGTYTPTGQKPVSKLKTFTLQT
jgi:hypothetical protein